MAEYPKLLQFAPFSSALDAGFWYQLSQQKLEIYKLEDTSVKIFGFYTNSGTSSLPPIANIDYTSFKEDFEVPPKCYPLWGILLNTNTLEDFKVIDKKLLIQSVGEKVWNVIKSEEALNDPQLLSQFLCLTFADLKKYHYYYWLAFPALSYPESICTEKPQKLKEYFDDDQIMQFIQSYDSLSSLSDKAFFMVHVSENGIVSVLKLKDYAKEKSKLHKVLLGFADPSNLDFHPGWPLRNLLSLVSYHWNKEKDIWDVLCLRDFIKGDTRSCQHSIVISIKMQDTDVPKVCPKTVGWEKNNNKLIPRIVNMSSTMDPSKLAESAVDLNLKLMKWRVAPELKLEDIIATKCLLLGAGTLGCNVARCLLSWGIRKISLVDNSVVSYSNPARQSLFNFEDCLNGGKQKAFAAAESLKRIFPGVDAQGYNLNIPMPGHSLPENTLETTKLDVVTLENLIKSHDVIFLLMDTRESRWLPTLLAASNEKLIINAALGFDTFLVIRHGVKCLSQELNESSLQSDEQLVSGDNLGCYFCNDVVAPGNSTRDRTLDQQCTVTRPGISFIAAAVAVELMVNIMQHPKRGKVSAAISSRDYGIVDMTSTLGIVPHQIRGYLSQFNNIMPTTRAFDRCTACSRYVIDKYNSDGFEFLVKVFNESDYLEDITGLTELHSTINMEDLWALSDSESS